MSAFCGKTVFDASVSRQERFCATFMARNQVGHRKHPFCENQKSDLLN